MICSTCEQKECISFLMNYNANTVQSLKNLVEVQRDQLSVLESRLYYLETQNGIKYYD